jgi:hypothetical protein
MLIKHIDLPISNHYLLVGSYALNMRYANDIDVICFEADIQTEYKKLSDYMATFEHKGRRVECLLADQQESLKLMLEEFEETTYELLYIMKAGHINIPRRKGDWEKHIHDYHILRAMVDTNDLHLKYLVKQHRKTTFKREKHKTPRLKNVTKEEFFDDAVEKYFDHDFIHEVMAHKENPMYTYMQPNPNIVHCDQGLWDKFPYEDKIKCVLEEAYVIALERMLIPATIKRERPTRPISAFNWALMRICTTLCSGWFRDFAVNNYYSILNSYNKNFDKIFFEHDEVRANIMELSR